MTVGRIVLALVLFAALGLAVYAVRQMGRTRD
jgi:hypothetical protein